MRNHHHARAFLAGGAVTTAMLAGAIVLFSALAAYVAFNGTAGDPAGSSTDSAVLVGTSGAPEAAAAAVSRGPGAVTAEPTAPTPVEPVAPPPGATAPSPNALAPGAPETALDTGTGSTIPGTTVDQSGDQGGGPLGGTVDGLQNTTENLGIDVPLDDATNGVTAPLDRSVKNSLNHVGGLLGNANLGDQVTTSLNGLAIGLLGEGGLTDQILAR